MALQFGGFQLRFAAGDLFRRGEERGFTGTPSRSSCSSESDAVLESSGARFTAKGSSGVTPATLYTSAYFSVATARVRFCIRTKSCSARRD